MADTSIVQPRTLTAAEVSTCFDPRRSRVGSGRGVPSRRHGRPAHLSDAFDTTARHIFAVGDVALANGASEEQLRASLGEFLSARHQISMPSYCPALSGRLFCRRAWIRSSINSFLTKLLVDSSGSKSQLSLIFERRSARTVPVFKLLGSDARRRRQQQC